MGLLSLFSVSLIVTNMHQTIVFTVLNEVFFVKEREKTKKWTHYVGWADRISKMRDGGSSDIDKVLWTLITNKRWLAVSYLLISVPFAACPLYCVYLLSCILYADCGDEWFTRHFSSTSHRNGGGPRRSRSLFQLFRRAIR